MRAVIFGLIGLLGLLNESEIRLVTKTEARSPTTASSSVRCSRFDVTSSTAYDPVAKRITLPWRDDLPATLTTSSRAWERIPLEDWQAYMAGVLNEIRAGQPRISGKRLLMAPDAQWWISPWMDFTTNGREMLNGLTRERSPDPGDVGPKSPAGLQVWAVGFYNSEGAYGLKQVFADPCDPKVPNANWTFPNRSASFKFLFTNGDKSSIPYVEGSPEIEAFIDAPGGRRTKQVVRLLQVDIAVRDPRAPTGWVFGTYVWKGPSRGDGFLDNLEPVGLMWGNDPGVDATPRDAFAILRETRLNPSLAGHVWRAPGQDWPARPWPGFQGRLNGPADNLRSSCISCHALSQWPRSRLNIVPNAAVYSLTELDKPAVRQQLLAEYMRNVRGGTLTLPEESKPSAERGAAVPLDYSLQIEAGFARLCSACRSGFLPGKTPAVCKVKRVPDRDVVTTPMCPPRTVSRTTFSVNPRAVHDDPPPRQ